jgi:outer membrane protein TolC
VLAAALAAGAADLPARVPLEAALRLALERSPRMAGARADLEQARGAQAEGSLLIRGDPELSGEYLSQLLYGREATRKWRVEGALPLEVAGQQWLRAEATRSAAQAAEEALAAAAAGVRAEVVTAYAHLHAAEQEAVLWRAAEDLARRLSAAADRRLEKGDVSEVDAAILQADALRFMARASAAEQALSAARLQLTGAVGAELPREVLAAGPVPAPAAPLLEARPVDSLPAVRAAARRAKAAEADLALAWRELVPDVTVHLGMEQGTALVELPGLEGHRVSAESEIAVKLSVPLPLFNWRSARRSAAEAQVRRAAAELESARALAAQAMAQGRRRAELALALDASYAAAVPRANRALEDVERAYQAGQLNLAEYQVRRDALYQVRLEAIAAERERAVAVAELERDTTEEGSGDLHALSTGRPGGGAADHLRLRPRPRGTRGRAGRAGHHEDDLHLGGRHLRRLQPALRAGGEGHLHRGRAPGLHRLPLRLPHQRAGPAGHPGHRAARGWTALHPLPGDRGRRRVPE